MKHEKFCNYCDMHFGEGRSRSITWKSKATGKVETGNACEPCYHYFTREAHDIQIIKKEK